MRITHGAVDRPIHKDGRPQLLLVLVGRLPHALCRRLTLGRPESRLHMQGSWGLCIGLRPGCHCIAKVGLGTKPASWILVWLRAHGSFPGFVLETPRRGRQKRKARSRGFCILYKVISWPGFVLSPTFWRKQSTMSGFVRLINGKRGVYT